MLLQHKMIRKVRIRKQKEALRQRDRRLEQNWKELGQAVSVWVKKGKKFVLPDEVFVDSTKIEWTASTADGEYLFPCMRVNETGDMFMIDWTYDEYYFAIYGKSPQETSDRDMAGKIALAIIYNLGGAE